MSDTSFQVPILADAVGHTLGLASMSDAARQLFFEQIGTLIIESTVLRYVALLNEAERAVFETWLASHATTEDLLEAACVTYPEFSSIFSQEMEGFRQDMASSLSELQA